MTMKPGMKVAVGVLLGACLVGGCAAPNDREMLGRVEGGTTLSLITPPAARPASGVTADEPSVTGLDRSGWETVVVAQPVDGVYAWHKYARIWHFTDETTRQRGGPVTPLSALEQSGDVGATLPLESAAAGPLAFTDLVLMPFKWFFAPPWQEVRALPESYWRADPQMAVTGQTAPKSDAADPAGVGAGVTP